MKLLIAQPKLSDHVMALKYDVENIACDCVFYPEGYVPNIEAFKNISELAKENHKGIITSYKTHEKPSDRAALIDETGRILFDRKKSGVDGPLLMPSSGHIHRKQIGYVLCREIFLDYDELKGADIIFNPIGVGMFSEEQFGDWTSRAKKMAIELNAYVVGTSHADGSYQNCGFSIPIAYVFDNMGEIIHLSKNDTRSVIVDLETRSVEYIK